MLKKIKFFFLKPFYTDGKISKYLLLCFLFINILVLINALISDPKVGYDIGAYIAYIKTLASFNLPNQSDTLQFFSPPLPFILPAIIYRLLDKLYELLSIGNLLNISADDFSIVGAVKFARLQNVLFSLGLTWFLLKICDIIQPKRTSFKLTTLFVLGLLPLYYKTFLFIKADGFMTFLAIVVIYYMLKISFIVKKFRLKDSIKLGVSLGLLILTRQWGFFLFPTIVVYFVLLIFKKQFKLKDSFKILLVSFSIAFVMGGWFYLSLKIKYGTFTKFNLEPAPTFSLSNQPKSFYFDLSLGQVFSDPIRPSFLNRFFPIMYSDVWGDYWCYFTVTGYDIKRGFKASLSNKNTMKSYLAKVNFVNLPITGLFLIAFVLHFNSLKRSIFNKLDRRNISQLKLFLLQFFLIVSIAGYFWFLIKYPKLGKGDTIKGSYIFHIFPILAILSGNLLGLIKKRYFRLYYLLIGFLIISFLFNAPLFITRYHFW